MAALGRPSMRGHKAVVFFTFLGFLASSVVGSLLFLHVRPPWNPDLYESVEAFDQSADTLCKEYRGGACQFADFSQESRLDPVAGKGELPEWLMEVAKDPSERQTSGVDWGWDYRVVSAIIFAVGLLIIGFQG